MELRCQRDAAQSKGDRERLLSLRNAKVESFKPAQECQRSTPCISSFPPDFLQAESQNKAVWINPHYVCSFPKLFCHAYLSLTIPHPQACTSITGFQEKVLVWQLSLEILPSTETNAKISSCYGRQTARIQLYAGWFNLVILCWEEFKSRSKESFPFWGTSKGFNCIWVHTRSTSTPAQLYSFILTRGKHPSAFSQAAGVIWVPRSLPAEPGQALETLLFLTFLSGNLMSHPSACSRPLEHQHQERQQEKAGPRSAPTRPGSLNTPGLL